MISRTNKYGKLIPLMMDARGHPRLMLGPNCNLFVTEISYFSLLSASASSC